MRISDWSSDVCSSDRKVTLGQRPDAELRLVVDMAESRSHGEKTYDTLANACRSFLKHDLPLAGIIRRDRRVRESKIGRAPGRESVCQYVSISVGADYHKEKLN